MPLEGLRVAYESSLSMAPPSTHPGRNLAYFSNMNATDDHPICKATGLGFTRSSNKRHVQVRRVAVCQFVSGRAARFG